MATEFRTFCAPNGVILDVGCGIEPRPAYTVTSAGSTYVGIDPLGGNKKRTFDFAKAIGEMMPFRPATFDWALYATSLDHFVEPFRALVDIRRVLKPNGRIELWVSVIDRSYFRRMLAFPSLRSRRNWGTLTESCRVSRSNCALYLCWNAGGCSRPRRRLGHV